MEDDPCLFSGAFAVSQDSLHQSALHKTPALEEFPGSFRECGQSLSLQRFWKVESFAKWKRWVLMCTDGGHHNANPNHALLWGKFLKNSVCMRPILGEIELDAKMYRWILRYSSDKNWCQCLGWCHMYNDPSIDVMGLGWKNFNESMTLVSGWDSKRVSGAHIADDFCLVFVND